MNSIKKRKTSRLIKNNSDIAVLLVALLVFPIIVGFIYALPLPQIVAIDSGDLIGFYGTSFGIVISFIIYRKEINNKEKERNLEIKPVFVVGVEHYNKETGVYIINVDNHSPKPISNLYIYDEFVESSPRKHYSFEVTYNKTKEEEDRIKPEFNITLDSEIIDEDGYPSYIQILCDDRDGNGWSFDYNKVINGERPIYYLSDAKMY
ncbi:MAG: hypothetical protein J6Z43_03200 [Clostridiales bacterium]|nr:hypothetical protein [Clostridiales bacterium]